MSTSSKNFSLLLILAVATILRCWNFFSIPFTYDEYSSLWRSSLGGVGDVIRDGVLTDTHPPLNTLFLFYWTKFFGMEEWIVKLPFVAMGIVSVFLVYRVGALWFSKSCGLMAAAWFAVLQESVMHAQIARPYIMGVMWLLFAAVFFSKVIKARSEARALKENIKDRHPQVRGAKAFRSLKRQYRLIAAYGIALALCAYTHHFAMLAAALLWLSGIILFRSEWKAQATAGVVAVVLYLPNIDILFTQLKLGGIGTVLAAPSLSFLPDYLCYVFHFSWWLVAVVVLIALSSIFIHQKIEKKFFWIALILFFGSLAIGFSYSHLAAPVLQNRVMFFVLPFFLLALFAFINLEKFKLQFIGVVIVLVAGSFSLAVERKYYEVFYKNGFHEVMEFAHRQSEKPGTQLNILACSPFILDYQKKKQGLDEIQIVNPDSTWTMCDYQHLVDTCNAERICFGWTTQYYRPPVEFMAMVMEKYPVVEAHENWFNSSAYIFIKGNVDAKSANFWKSPDGQYNFQSDSASSTFHTYLTGQEFGSANKSNVQLLQKHNYDLLFARCNVHPLDEISGLGDAMFVLEVLEGDSTTAWFGNRLSDFECNADSDFTAFVGCYSPDVFREPNADYKVKCYIWNRGGDFWVEKMEVGVLPGNPLVYGLMEELE